MWIEISLTDNSNKRIFIQNSQLRERKSQSALRQNIRFESSLAEELSAICKNLEKLRIDREKTEKMLKERNLLLDLQIKEMLNKGELQKQLELEVDRFFQLKKFRLSNTVTLFLF